jgi:hypothetical protein
VPSALRIRIVSYQLVPARSDPVTPWSPSSSAKQDQVLHRPIEATARSRPLALGTEKAPASGGGRPWHAVPRRLLPPCLRLPPVGTLPAAATVLAAPECAPAGDDLPPICTAPPEPVAGITRVT